MCPDLPGSLTSTQIPPVFGAEAGGCSGIPTLPPVLRVPGRPHPSVHDSPSGPQVVGIHKGGAPQWAPGAREGQAWRTKSLGWGGTQCPPRGDSGSVSRPPPGTHWALVPREPVRGESQQHLCSADPLRAGGNHSPGRAWLLGVTHSESLWQRSTLPTQAPAPSGDLNGHLEVKKKLLTTGWGPSKGARNRGTLHPGTPGSTRQVRRLMRARDGAEGRGSRKLTGPLGLLQLEGARWE